MVSSVKLTAIGAYLAIASIVLSIALSFWPTSSSPEFRFRYMLLDIEGALVTDGASYPLNDDSLRKLFGGSQVYVQRNVVLQRARALASDLFARNDIGQIQHATFDEYAHALHQGDDVLKTDLGVAAGETMWRLSVLPTNRWLAHRRVLRSYAAQRIAEENPDLSDTFLILFEDSRHQCVTVEALEHSYVETIYPAPMKMLVLEVENISDVPARSVAFEASRYRADGSLKLHSRVAPAGNRLVTETSEFPVRILTKGEHVLIPLCILIEKSRHYMWADPVPPTFTKRPLKSTGFDRGEASRTAQFFSGGPEVEEEFRYFGPAMTVNSVRAKNKRFQVRPFSFSNLTYAAVSGGGVGSCPALTVRAASTNRWLRRGNVLVGARDAAREREDIIRLPDFGGALILSEEEAEVTYLDYVEIRVNEKVCRAKLPELARRDGLYLVMNKGDRLQLNCESPGSAEAHFVVRGYYEPLQYER